MRLLGSLSICTVLALSYLSLAAADDQDARFGDVALLQNGMSPRWYMEAQPAHAFVKRQSGLLCGAGAHNCLDLGPLGVEKCCPDSQYCFFQANWTVGCCGQGANCDANCPSAGVRVNTTITSTSTSTSTPTSGGTPDLIDVVSTITAVACSGRPCSINFHLCASSFGNRCCPNGQTCASSGQCLAAVSTTDTAVVATPSCSGTPNAYACPVGGGCCENGRVCIESGGKQLCSGTPIAPPGTNLTSSESLSSGAKAGIGAGIAVAAALVIGALTWFCIRRRRDARSAAARTARHPTPDPNATVVGGDMSEVSGPSRGHRPHAHGLVYDYFGPAATRGPFSQDDDTPHESPGVVGYGVPVRPDRPGDITAPVEIDSRLRAGDAPAVERNPSQRTAGTLGSRGSPGVDGQDGPFELYGSFGDPSPLSPDEMGSPSRGHQSPSPGIISPYGGTL